ncbi:hypothetical protein BD289DRAFT_254037 [Coniella lustricola]|uniref:Uncharacterized protein n=1 Tax=Coniella lustricola TaxID=2025994 RepID=A0A2T3A877_9PEZI|nr:hypothetical protein BD289DRAFT_254037 [Coniella lustricola]
MATVVLFHGLLLMATQRTVGLWLGVSMFSSQQHAYWHRTEADFERFSWLLEAFALNSMTMYQIVKSMVSLTLLAKQSLTACYRGSLPDDQCQLEVKHWFEINLATWQDMFVSLVTDHKTAFCRRNTW